MSVKLCIFPYMSDSLNMGFWCSKEVFHTFWLRNKNKAFLSGDLRLKLWYVNPLPHRDFFLRFCKQS